MKLIPLLLICLSLTPSVHAELDREENYYYCYEETIHDCKNLKKGDQLRDIHPDGAILYCDKDEPIIRRIEKDTGYDNGIRFYRYNCIYNGKKIKTERDLGMLP